MKKIISTILLFLATIMSFAQYKLNNGSNGTKNVCSGTFTDSGGPGGNYSNSQSGTITFCPDQPGKLIKLSFTSFETESSLTGCDDYLDIWNGATVGTPNTRDDRLCGQRGSFNVISSSPNGCLSFRFVSDGSSTKSGWEADVSCVTPCVNPIAEINDNAPVNLCNSSSLIVSVDGSNSTAPGSGNSISKYEWDWGDGSSSSSTSPSSTHTYSSPGVYLIRLVVRNNNFGVDPQGCRSTNAATKLVKIAASPDFTGTVATVNINCGESATLNGIVTSQTKLQQVPVIVSGLIGLPDGTGVSYTSTLDFTGLFPAGSKVTPGCYPEVKFSLEHSYSEDLLIELISPSGKSVKLFDKIKNGGGVSGLSVFGTCVNNNDDGVPGCTATYTVVNNGGVSWTANGVTTQIRTNCPSYSGSCLAFTSLGDPVLYFKSQKYNSTESFSVLDGTDLNGIWSLKITDTRIEDDGVLTDWSLVFPQSCYTPLENITPKINSAVWEKTSAGDPDFASSQSPVSTTVTNPGPDNCPTCIGNKLSNSISVGPFLSQGSYVYTLTATDENSCEYTKDVTVNVSACPPCPTITGASSSQSVCIDGNPSAFSVSTTATGSNAISFKYFDIPKSGDAVYTDAGGTVLKSVTPSSGLASYDPDVLGAIGSLPNVSDDYYVYALLTTLPSDVGCRPFQEIKVSVNNNTNTPQFDPVPSLCIDTDPAPVLPNISKEGIRGKWNPDLVSTKASATYTFTPDPDQCAQSTTMDVKILLNPVVDAGDPQVDILYGQSFTLQGFVSGTNNYEWTPTTDMAGPNTLTPVVNPTNDIVYTLTATNADNCIAKDSVKIVLLTDLIIPNAFSPNGDGVNDKFVIGNLDKYKDATVEIFNRYGQSIIRIVGGSNSWDGRVNGKIIETGTYFYIISPNSGKMKVVTGSLSIIR